MNINIKKSIFCAALLISGTHISVSKSFPGGSIVSSCASATKGFFTGLKFSGLRLPAFVPSFSFFSQNKDAAVSMLKSFATHKALAIGFPSLSDKIPSETTFENDYANSASSFGLSFLKKFVNEVGGECIEFAANQNKSHADAIKLFDLGATAFNSLTEYLTFSVAFNAERLRIASFVVGKAVKSIFFPKLSSFLTNKAIARFAVKSKFFDNPFAKLLVAALLKAGAETSFNYLWSLPFVEAKMKNHVKEVSFVASFLPKKLQENFAAKAKSKNDDLSSSFYSFSLLHPVQIYNLNGTAADVRRYNNSDYNTQQEIGKDKDAAGKVIVNNNSKINIVDSDSEAVYVALRTHILNAMKEKEKPVDSVDTNSVKKN